jgi:GT2 family glycosyltransferase
MTPLIAMAVHDTEENKRTDYTKRTIEESILPTGAIPYVVDNASHEPTSQYLRHLHDHGCIHLITNLTNVGTAKAVNQAWEHRARGQHAVKMDNDVIIKSTTWIDELAEVFDRDPSIGIVGLKRKDCWESTIHPDPFYRSSLWQLPQVAGQRWITVEKVNHVIGTCQMFNSALLDKIGYLYQPRLYGFDDALAAVRCQVAGFASAFLPHIEIDHIDTGETSFQGWKERHASEDMAEFNRLKEAYRNGSRPIFEPATW